MSERLSVTMDRLGRIPGVRGALVADAQAGLPVVAELAGDLAAPALAALAVSAFRRAERAPEAAALGSLETLQLEAERGHVIIAGAGDLVVVVVAEADAQLGLVRLEARRAAEELR